MSTCGPELHFTGPCLTAIREHTRSDFVLSLLKIFRWLSAPELVCWCGVVCLSAGDGCVLSGHYCCGVYSCGYAPSPCPFRKTETSPCPSCLLDDCPLARVCVSLKRGRRSRGLSLSPAPSLCLGPCLIWPECGTLNGNASASSCDRIPHLRCYCGVRSAWSHCCCGGWSWTWGGGEGVRAGVAGGRGYDWESENVSESCRSLSDSACCCNCGEKRRWTSSC